MGPIRFQAVHFFPSASIFGVANPSFLGGNQKLDVSRVAGGGLTLKDLMIFFPEKKCVRRFSLVVLGVITSPFRGGHPFQTQQLPPQLPSFYQGFDWGRGTPESSTISPNSYYMSMSLGTLRITGDNTPQWKGEWTFMTQGCIGPQNS